MRFLDRLQRERYLVLRSLRVAHAYLDQIERGQLRPEQGLPELVDFLSHFVMDHFFAQEEALLEEFERRQRIQAHLGELFQLRQEHELGRAILGCVAEAMARSQAQPRRLQVDLGKLITQLSHALIRGQNAVQRVQVTVRAGAGGGHVFIEEIGERLEPREDIENRYVRLLEELEAAHLDMMEDDGPTGTGDGGPPPDEGTGTHGP